MGVDGSAYYETFKHLNAKVIKPAVAEVNKTSNILVAPETRRQGRVVTDIRFRIKETRNWPFRISTMARDAPRPVYARLRGLGSATGWRGNGWPRMATIRWRQAGLRRIAPEREKQGGLSDRGAGRRFRRRRPAVEIVVPNERVERLRRIQDAIKARTPTQRDADRRLFLSQLCRRHRPRRFRAPRLDVAAEHRTHRRLSGRTCRRACSTAEAGAGAGHRPGGQVLAQPPSMTWATPVV